MSLMTKQISFGDICTKPSSLNRTIENPNMDGFTFPRISEQSKSVQKDRLINWLWNYEDRFSYHPEYPLSRLYPYFSDYENFKSLIGLSNLQALSFIDKYQMFLTWLTDCALGKTGSAVYYMALIGGIPPLPPPFLDEKPSDFRRFV